jgi:DNA-binding NtrC family response regulator
MRDFTEDAVLEALRQNGYKPGAAARHLGISRNSIYGLIESSRRIRKASDLGGSEIGEALAGAGQNVVEAARALEVSERGLRLRMKQLGMS